MIHWKEKKSNIIYAFTKCEIFVRTDISLYHFQRNTTDKKCILSSVVRSKGCDCVFIGMFFVCSWARGGSLYLACNDKNAFFTSEQPKRYKLWSCQKMCDALQHLLDNIFIIFDSKLYRQIVCSPMGTSCAPLVADLFLFCYVGETSCCLCQTIIKLILLKLLNSTSRYSDDLLNIDNSYFQQMVSQIYPTEL